MSKSYPFLKFLIGLLPENIRLKLICYQEVRPLDYDKGQIKMRVKSNISNARTKSCAKEPHTITWLKDSLKETDVFYDIGANTGAYSLVAAELLKKNGKVIAFEPVPSTFMELCENIVLNDFTSVISPLCIPLSDEDKITSFSLNSLSGGSAMHLGLSNTAAVTHTDEIAFQYPVHARTLDSVIREYALPLPNCIKIDVDGFEFEILQGAKQTLSKPGVRAIQLEMDESTYPVKKIVDYLQEFGFAFNKKSNHNNSIFDYTFIKS